MNPQGSRQSKPLAAVSHALKSLFGLQKDQPEFEEVNPVDEVRAGLKDIKEGRVRQFKSARDLLQDE